MTVVRAEKSSSKFLKIAIFPSENIGGHSYYVKSYSRYKNKEEVKTIKYNTIQNTIQIARKIASKICCQFVLA